MNATHRVRPLLEFGAWADNDPFLGLMEDWFPRGVFDRHPHRGIETVTYVLEGELEHYDNHGNAGIIRPGDAQWVTAGRGVIHNEIPAEGVTVHSLQLWVNLPAVRLRSAWPQRALGTNIALGPPSAGSPLWPAAPPTRFGHRRLDAGPPRAAAPQTPGMGHSG